MIPGPLLLSQSVLVCPFPEKDDFAVNSAVPFLSATPARKSSQPPKLASSLEVPYTESIFSIPRRELKGELTVNVSLGPYLRKELIQVANIKNIF